MKRMIGLLLVFVMLSGVMVFGGDEPLSIQITFSKTAIPDSKYHDFNYGVSVKAEGGRKPYQYKYEIIQNEKVLYSIDFNKYPFATGKLSEYGNFSIRVIVKDNSGLTASQEQVFPKSDVNEWFIDSNDQETGPHFLKSRDYNIAFLDIGESQWYYESVKRAYEYSFIDGDNHLFYPNDNITIAEMITIAARMHSKYTKDGETFTSSLSNISTAKTERWYQPYIDYAIKFNIISEGQFNDYEQVAKRYEVASIISSTFPLDFYTVVKPWDSIPDVPKSMPYFNDVCRLYNAGILSGNDEYGTFYPNSDIRRCEVASIIKKIIDKDSGSF